MKPLDFSFEMPREEWEKVRQALGSVSFLADHVDHQARCQEVLSYLHRECDTDAEYEERRLRAERAARETLVSFESAVAHERDAAKLDRAKRYLAGVG